MSHLLEKTDPVIFRANISKQFASLFTDCKNEKLGENIEKSVFNFTIKEATNNQIIKKWKNPLFCEIYHSRLRAIYINLKNNIDLQNQLKNGEISMNHFAFMTHQEMNPSQWKDRIERKIKRDI